MLQENIILSWASTPDSVISVGLGVVYTSTSILYPTGAIFNLVVPECDLSPGPLPVKADMAVKSSGRMACLLSHQFCKRPICVDTKRPRRHLHVQARPVKQDIQGAFDERASQNHPHRVEHDDTVPSSDLVRAQLDLHSPVDVLREVLLHNNGTRPRHDHIKHVDQQSSSLLLNTSIPATPKPPSFPLNGEPLPHPVLRDAMNSRPGMKEVRRIMREQLIRCQLPRDILRVVAVAMQRKETAKELSRMSEYLRWALYRSRNNASDEAILMTINVICLRLKADNLPVPDVLLILGMKFAARSRSLPGMKRYLKQFKMTNLKMTRGIFRSIIAKFSIGARGLGEIRNGRWKRKELLQVLLGFEDTPPDEAHHLEVFLQRDDWQFFHAWLAVLSRCKAVDELWKEWKWWLESQSRNNPRKLNCPGSNLNTRKRGDYWFMEQMVWAGDLEKAWEMLRVSGTPFANVRPHIRSVLLEGAEYATFPDEHVSKGLLQKYGTELAKIENALGVKWVCGKDGRGHHQPTIHIEEKLDILASPDFALDPHYGFPWEEEPTAKGKICLRRC